MARIKVTKQLSGVKTRVNEMTKRGQYAFANQVHADSNLYAPRLSGDLRMQSQITNDNKQIVWNAPYARRHYYNQMTNYSTPGTGPKWDQKAKSIHMKSWERVAKAAMK